MKYTARSIISIALVAAATAAAAAEGDIPNHPALTAKWFFAAGVFVPETTTQAQLTTRAGVGANIDFENALGITDEKEVPGVMARWRFGERWRLEAEYFEMNRGATRTIDRTITWGDQTFPVNAQVATSFDFSDLRVSLGYSFFRTRDKELGAGIGVHVASYDASLSANAIGSQAEDVLAPLPVFTIYGQFALTDQWAVSARLDRLSLKVDKYDGSIGALGVDLLYQPFRNVGFGLGYRTLLFDLEVEEDDGRRAHFRQTFQGPMAFISVSF